MNKTQRSDNKNLFSIFEIAEILWSAVNDIDNNKKNKYIIIK